ACEGSRITLTARTLPSAFSSTSSTGIASSGSCTAPVWLVCGLAATMRRAACTRYSSQLRATGAGLGVVRAVATGAASGLGVDSGTRDAHAPSTAIEAATTPARQMRDDSVQDTIDLLGQFT